jgi:hypothetical protein
MTRRSSNSPETSPRRPRQARPTHAPDPNIEARPSHPTRLPPFEDSHPTLQPAGGRLPVGKHAAPGPRAGPPGWLPVGEGCSARSSGAKSLRLGLATHPTGLASDPPASYPEAAGSRGSARTREARADGAGGSRTWLLVPGPLETSCRLPVSLPPSACLPAGRPPAHLRRGGVLARRQGNWTRSSVAMRYREGGGG